MECRRRLGEVGRSSDERGVEEEEEEEEKEEAGSGKVELSLGGGDGNGAATVGARSEPKSREAQPKWWTGGLGNAARGYGVVPSGGRSGKKGEATDADRKKSRTGIDR